MDLGHRIIKLARTLSKADAQNRLMTLTDRELALCMLYFKDVERRFLFSFLPAAKCGRIKQELELAERVTVHQNVYTAALKKVFDVLKYNKAVKNKSSYLKPVRIRNRR